MRTLSHRVERFALLPFRAPVATVVVALALTVLAVMGIGRIKTDDSLSQLFRSEDPAFREFERASREFPSSEYDVLIVASGQSLLEAPRAPAIDAKLEVVVIPVSDVDRAKRFYGGLGWRLDVDFASGDDFRVIQFTPPGSRCSVIFGKNVTVAAPGSAQGLYLIVSDIEAARKEFLGRGVEISELFHDAGDLHAGSNEPYLFGRLRVSGLDPEHRSYRSFASFSDPDGNGWLFQEVTARLPGRMDADKTTFAVSAARDHKITPRDGAH